MLDFSNLLSPEEKFKESFPREAFEALGLPPDVIPKRILPLPQENGVVKKRFASYETLAKVWLTRPLLHRYSEISPVIDKPIYLFTWVMNDGFGDLATQVEAARVIKRAFPNLDLRLVSLVERRKMVNFESPFPHEIIPYDGHQKTDIPEQIIEEMKKASVIIQIPTIYPYWDELSWEDGPERVTIGEYGFIDSDWFHPESDTLCMGLHSLEHGLLLPETISFTKENFYFAYLKSARGFAIYLHALLAKEKRKDLHVIYLDSLPLLTALKNESWQGYQLDKIVILDQGTRHVMEINEGTRTLLLEKKEGLSPNDIQTLIAKSQPFVGCRGDRSFSEVVAMEAFFFYDAPIHSRPFLHDLVAIAHFPLLEEYLELLLDTDSPPKDLGRKIASFLEEPSLYYAMQKLHGRLKTDYSFNQTLLNLVTQKTHHHFHKGLKKSDLELLARVLAHEKPLKNLVINNFS